MEEYLTTKELSKKIKMTEGTIRNLVWKKELKENVHYVKPTARKILFVWSAIEGWLYAGRQKRAAERVNSLINI